MDATTGKKINMTNIKIKYDVDKEATATTPIVISPEAVFINSTIINPPHELTSENFRVLLDHLSKFLQSEKAEYESSPKDREKLEKEIEAAKNETDFKNGWSRLERVISAGGSIASIVSLFLMPLNPSAAASIGIPATIITALKKIAEKNLRQT